MSDGTAVADCARCRSILVRLARGGAMGLLLAVGLASAQEARPRIGLVLGGGGARGAAHIGVLEVLERLRVPVDCVAGTSMGALIAGAWVAGKSPAQLRVAMAEADWGDMFQDNPEYSELDFRNKRTMQRFLPGSEMGIQHGGVVTPPGFLLGQKIKLFLNRLVHADRGETEIEKLPLPLSLIAADIGTGERVVYRDGSLAQAMRASMSVPGLIAPAHYRDRRLVDGGLVDNLPVGEVRSLCRAEKVIAVDVGTPPLPGDQVSGMLGVAAQFITLLTQQNVNASVATLRAGDIYIQPKLDGIASSDFERHADAIGSGRDAAQAVAAALSRLSLDEAAYAQWQRGVRGPAPALPRVDDVEIAGLIHADRALLQRHLEQHVGQPLDPVALNRDLMRAYGDGYYETVDYTVQSINGRHLLRVMPVEKSWGPDYVRFGAQLDSSLQQGAAFQLRGGYQKTWINDRGGELLVTGEVGRLAGAGVEFFQPLTVGQGWFLDAAAAHARERIDLYNEDQRISEYLSSQTRLDLMTGYSLPRLGQLRAGWRWSRATRSLQTGIDILALYRSRPASGAQVTLDLDRFDRLYFPRKGWAVQASWFEASRGGYAMQKLDLRGAVPLEDFVLGGRLSWVGSYRGELPLRDAGTLGGFLNLTGYSTNQFIGDHVAYAHLRAERIIGRLPMGLRGDMRVGLALEAGKLLDPYTPMKHTDWLGSLALYLGGETPFGPVYVGLGRGRGASYNAYLFLGTP
jgi:NTE family protein